jgi:hypothetical protein
MTKGEAYKVAMEADAAFQAALVKAYGKRCAGDARYQSAHPGHPAVEAAKVAKVAADEALRAAQVAR